MITIKTDSKLDANYKIDELETEDPVAIYIDQIQIALGSEVGSILGSDNNIDLEDLVFESNLDKIDIKRELINILSNFCSLYPDFDTDVDVNFANGQIREICLVTLTVNQAYSFQIIIS